MTKLPAEGRQGPPLRWPFPGRAPALWAQLCSLPQAVAWEQMHLERVVARYTRCVLAAEKPEAASSLLAEVRQLEDRLGLSPMAMLRLRWEVAPDELGQRRDEHAQPTPPATPRRRFKVVGDPTSS